MTPHRLKEVEHIEQTRLLHDDYHWNKETDVNGIIVLAYGLLYNHSDRPNATYQRDFHRLPLSSMAIRDIQPGDEITVNDNGHPDDRTPLWFEPADETSSGRWSAQ